MRSFLFMCFALFGTFVARQATGAPEGRLYTLAGAPENSEPWFVFIRGPYDHFYPQYYPRQLTVRRYKRTADMPSRPRFLGHTLCLLQEAFENGQYAEKGTNSNRFVSDTEPQWFRGVWVLELNKGNSWLEQRVSGEWEAISQKRLLVAVPPSQTPDLSDVPDCADPLPVSSPPSPPTPPPQPPMGGSCQFCSGYDPVVLDLAGRGVEISRPEDWRKFDLDANGQAERIAWVISQDTPLLVFDRDLDGKITSGREVFGDFTRSPMQRVGQSGFETLRMWDDNDDGVIDGYDPIFIHLRLWFDRNADAVSDPGELVDLPAAGIELISLASQEINRIDVNGNGLIRQSDFVMNRNVLRKVYEVLLKKFF